MKTLLYVLSFIGIALTRDERDNPMEYALPLQLPDQNQDGQSDNHDFQRAFLGLHLTRYEISQLFEVVDRDRNGKVSQVEWSEFYNTFVQPFEAAQTAPREGLLDAAALTKTLEDLPTIKQLIEEEEDKGYLEKIMETLSSRISLTLSGKTLSLNLNEFVFFRRAAIAWQQCTQQKNFISKSSMQTCAQSIMLPNVHFSENQQIVFFWAIRHISRPSEIVSDMFKFLSFTSAFFKYDMFQRIGQNKINSGVLNYKELRQAAQDSEGPSQKLNVEILETVFGKEKVNLEFTGLDFKQFYMLMQCIDNIYIYGKKQNTFIDYEEFNALLDGKEWQDIYVDNIDDVKNDVKEEEEKPDAKTLWGEQKLLSQAYKMRKMKKTHNGKHLNKKHAPIHHKNVAKKVKAFRFLQKTKNMKKRDAKVRTMEKNEIARNVTFNIFDLSHDKMWNGGELFLFHKFSFIFQGFVKGDIHLIYQKNLDFDKAAQQKYMEISLFKEELAQLIAFQRFLRKQSKFQEVAINFIQFTSSFYYKHHFMLDGQQSLVSTKTPFPSFVRMLNYLGMELHREDIENAIEYVDKQPPAFLPAQKFDLEAYKKDGAQVDFEIAYHKSLLRWSKSFMRKKFFEGNEKRRRRLN